MGDCPVLRYYGNRGHRNTLDRSDFKIGAVHCKFKAETTDEFLSLLKSVRVLPLTSVRPKLHPTSLKNLYEVPHQHWHFIYIYYHE